MGVRSRGTGGSRWDVPVGKGVSVGRGVDVARAIAEVAAGIPNRLGTTIKKTAKPMTLARIHRRVSRLGRRPAKRSKNYSR